MELKAPQGVSRQGGRAMTVAYIALGGNLGDVRDTLDRAVGAIGLLPTTRVLTRSSWVRTEPVGVTNQPEFLNGAIGVETTLSARELLDGLLAIESAHGRDRSSGERWGPRTLDLDLLLFGTDVIDEEGLHVPHPRMTERAFVLIPLAEIASHALIPTVGMSVAETLAALESR